MGTINVEGIGNVEIAGDTPTPEEMRAIVSARVDRHLDGPLPEEARGNPWARQSGMQDVGAGIIQGLRDIPNAGAQLLTNALPESVVSGVNDATQFVNELPPIPALGPAGMIGPITETLGMTPATGDQINESIAQQEQEYQAGRDGGFDWSRLGGNVMGALPLGLAGGTTMLGAALSGAGMGALTPQTDGDFDLETTAGNAALGGLGGVGGNLLGKGLAAAVSPVPEAVQTLLSRGVNMTLGQRVGGWANKIEQTLANTPLLGAMASKARNQSWDDFNRAVYADILDGIGAVPPMRIGREGVTEVGDAISRGYDEILPMASFNPDAQFAREFSNLYGLTRELPEDLKRSFDNMVRSRLGSYLDGTPMDGQTFKELESFLSAQARRASATTNLSDQQLGDVYSELLFMIRDGFARTNQGTTVQVGGQAVDLGQRLADLNLAWAKLTRLERAAQMTGAQDGVFSPAQFFQATRAMDSSVRNRGFARGDALMQDLAEAGRNVLGTTQPNSGTPGQMAVLAAGAGYVEPSTLALSGLLSLPYTQAGTRMTNGLLNSVPTSPAAAIMLRDALPALGLLGASTATQ